MYQALSPPLKGPGDEARPNKPHRYFFKELAPLIIQHHLPNYGQIFDKGYHAYITEQLSEACHCSVVTTADVVILLHQQQPQKQLLHDCDKGLGVTNSDVFHSLFTTSFVSYLINILKLYLITALG